MKQFLQHVLIRNQWVTEDFCTEPIETGWAGEATFFIEILATNEQFSALKAEVQISPNGISWVSEGTVFTDISEHGLYYKKINHFGGWLRLKCSYSGQDANARMMVYLILKE